MRTPHNDAPTRVTSPFQQPERPDHNGLDEKGGEAGTLPGVLVYSPVTATCALASIGYNYGRGNKVLLVWYEDGVKHWLTAQHLASLNVKAGQAIVEGQLLGVEGWSGDVVPANVNGSHTHWEYNIGGVLQSYGEVKGGKLADPAPLLCIKNKRGVYPVDGWNGALWIVDVEVASRGDREQLESYCKQAAVNYAEGAYTGPLVAPEGNDLASVRMGPMSQGDLDHILQMCEDGNLAATVHN